MRPRLLIIALLAALAALLPVIGGYRHLSLAASATDSLRASAEYESAARLLTWRGDLYEKSGQAALAGGDAARAIQMFELARQGGALTPGGRLGLADAYFSAGETGKAISEWQALLNEGQAREQASRALSQHYLKQQQFEAAGQILRRWLEFDPQNVEASYQLALVLLADAAPEALPLLQTAGNDPSLASRATELIPALEIALAEPATVYRLTVCGRALAAVGEWPLAERAFLRAVDADPTYAPAWAWLGEARQQTGSGEALPHLQKAVSLAPQAVEMRVMLGLYWQRQGEWAKARDEFEAAALLEPDNPLWQMSLGEMYARLGNLVTALGYYQDATRLAPHESGAWRALALFCVENDSYLEDVGREAALQALALEPGSAQNMDVLGRVLLATGDPDSAEAMFQKAIAAAPGDPAPLFHLGLLYLQTGQSDRARQSLLSAQALDGDGPIGAQAKKVLERYFP